VENVGIAFLGRKNARTVAIGMVNLAVRAGSPAVGSSHSESILMIFGS